MQQIATQYFATSIKPLSDLNSGSTFFWNLNSQKCYVDKRAFTIYLHKKRGQLWVHCRESATIYIFMNAIVKPSATPEIQRSCQNWVKNRTCDCIKTGRSNHIPIVIHVECECAKYLLFLFENSFNLFNILVCQFLQEEKPHKHIKKISFYQNN